MPRGGSGPSGGTTYYWEKRLSGGTWVPFETTPTAAHPNETFTVGTWDIRVTVTNKRKSTTTTTINYITVTAVAPDAGPTISITASRSSGVAPLAVFFDASATTDATTTNPFHELGFQWNFADNDSVTYSTTGGKKNRAQGPVAVHVFEDPGTYNVVLTVSNGLTSSQQTTQIIVSDPNTVFTGAATIAIANGAAPVAGVDGVPAGATCVGSITSWPTVVNTYATVGKRVLLKHDDTFTGAATAALHVSGPGTIGMYGSGAKPIIRTTGTASGSAMLTPTGTTSDWRLMDLYFDGQSNTNREAIHGTGAFALSQLLLLRVDMQDLGIGVTLDSNSSAIDQITFADCTVKRIKAATGIEVVATRLGVLGTEFDDSATTGFQLLRVQYCDRGVISHNSISNVRTGIEMLALRTIDIGGSGPYAAGVATKHVVISNNIINTNTYCGINVDPNSDGSTPGALSDVILESNFFKQVGTGGVACQIHGTRVTVRNNTGVWSNANGPICISLLGTLAGVCAAATDVWVYNNSFYTAASADVCILLYLASGQNDITATMRNNILYCPNFTGPEEMRNSGSSNLVTSSNNLVSKTTNPMFTTTPPTTAAHFATNSASPAVDSGYAVPVRYDYALTSRPQGAAIDKGAYER